jgi:hypothetical protein
MCSHVSEYQKRKDIPLFCAVSLKVTKTDDDDERWHEFARRDNLCRYQHYMDWLALLTAHTDEMGVSQRWMAPIE